MKINNHPISVVVLLPVTTSVLLSLYLSWDINRVPYSPDEASVLFFSDHLVNTGTALWHSDLNDAYGVDFFRARHMIHQGDNNYASQHSMAWIVLLSMGQIDTQFLNLQALLSLISALGVLVVYLLVREVFNKETALIAAILTCILPPYVAFSNTFNDILPTMTAYLLSLYCFFRFASTQKSSYLGLAGLFFVVSVFLRDANAIVYVAGYIPLLLIFRDRLNFRTSLIAFSCLALALLPFGFVNVVTYGGFLVSGRSAVLATYPEVGASVIPFSIEDLSSAIYHHILDFLPLLLLGVLGMITAFKLSFLKERKMRTGFVLSALVVMATTVIFYGSRSRLYGLATGWLFSSPTRYFFPIYIFLVMCTAPFLRYLYAKVDGSSRIATICVVLALIVSFLTLSFGDAEGSLRSKKNSIRGLSHLAAAIDNLPQDSVVFTQRSDKIVFPSRAVALVFDEEFLKEHPLHTLTPIVDIRDDVIPVIDELLHDGKSVYVTADAEELISFELGEESHELVKTEQDWLYRIEQWEVLKK